MASDRGWLWIGKWFVLFFVLLLFAWVSDSSTWTIERGSLPSTSGKVETSVANMAATSTPVRIKVGVVPTAAPTILADAPTVVVSTPSPSPTPESAIEAPIRVLIPAIHLQAKVKNNLEANRSKASIYRTVLHDASSNYPGEGSNVVLLGHNNFQGSVFRQLPRLKIGDEIELQTENNTYYYLVRMKDIFPYKSKPAEGFSRLATYLESTESETLTLVSCYPYLTNTHRVVVVADLISSHHR